MSTRTVTRVNKRMKIDARTSRALCGRYMYSKLNSLIQRKDALLDRDRI
jgi:hypothetical protein